MHGVSCDRCGGALLVQSNVRYVVTIDVRAAYDPLELTTEDLEKDHAAEIREVLRQIEGIPESELQNQIQRTFNFDLCHPCQRSYVKRPLP